MIILFPHCGRSKRTTKPEQSGFTLIELLMVTAIIAIVALLASYLPAKLGQQTHIQIAGNSIASIVRLARNLAISSQTTVLLCPVGENSTCIGQWSNDIAVFIDTNNNTRIDADERILFRHDASDLVHVTYSRRVASIRFYATGRINNNGSFHICPVDGDNTIAFALVLNRQGRLRHGVDSDNDGIVEGAGGNNVSCVASG